MSFRSFTPRPPDLQPGWWLADADGAVLGRLATQIAGKLRGKHKPIFSPHADAGDFVVVVNAAKIRVTGRKLTDKQYYSHSGYPGGLKQRSLEELLATYPERVIERAVRGMLPKNALGRHLARRLRVYAGPDHPHAAHQPQALVAG